LATGAGDMLDAA